MATIGATKRPPSRLEALPAELRTNIYYYAVVEEGLVEAATYLADCMDDEDCEWKNNEPALAKTCRQIRLEVLPVYYGCNTFALQDVFYAKNHERCISSWLSSLGPLACIINHVSARIMSFSFNELPDGTEGDDKTTGIVIATVLEDQPTELKFDPPEIGKCRCSEIHDVGYHQPTAPVVKSRVNKVTRLKTFLSGTPGIIDTGNFDKDGFCDVCRFRAAIMA